MARLTIAMGVSMVVGGVLLGCGGSEAATPVATPVATSPSSTTPESPNFTRNSGETTDADDQAATTVPPGSTATNGSTTSTNDSTNDSTTVVPTTIDATNQATRTTTRGTSTGSTATTTTTAATAATTTTTVAAASTSTDPVPAVQDDIDLGVLTMKNFIIDLLGDGIQIVYDDIDLDDTELACVGRAEAAGIPADGFEELLFECLDDDSFGFVIRATDGDGDGGP